jgi:hypothetical protein
MADRQLVIQLQAQMGDVLSQFDAISAAATAMGGNIQQQMTAAANASSAAWSAAVASVNAQGNPIMMNNDVFATVGASAQASSTAATAAMASTSAAVKAVVPPVNALGNAFKTALGVIGVASIGQIILKLKAFATAAVSAFTTADAAAKEFEGMLQERGVSIANSLKASTAVAGIGGAAGFEPEAIQQAMTNSITKLGSGSFAVQGFAIAMDDARIKGISLATAVQSVTIAAEGSLKALRQFGVTQTKDVNGNLKTMSELLKEMAANMKGGLATYLQTPLGMIDRMKVALQELKESVGGAFTNLFAPVAQGVTGFAQAMVAMIATSDTAAPSLNQLAVEGAQIAKQFYDAAISLKIFAAWVAPVFTFGMISGKESNAKIAELEKAKKDADDAANKVIQNLATATPSSITTDYLKQLQDLLKGVTSDSAVAAAAGTKTAAAWQAAFAPLTLLSGNIPALAKYIGNLSSNFVLRSKLDITITDNTKPPSSPALGAVKSAVLTSLGDATRIYHGITGETPMSHGAGGYRGAGLSFLTGGG